LEFTADGIDAYEVKSGQTISSEFTTRLHAAIDGLESAIGPGKECRAHLVYGGDAPRRQHDVDIIPWSAL
jgi:hypothetical protein